jgi:GNAT superfamily N-acetyltransferase
MSIGSEPAPGGPPATSFDRDRGLALQRRAMRDWIAMLGGASRGASFHDAGGIGAAIVPAVPDRSIANSVTYDSTAALLASLDDLARRYDEAGVNAWTVWAPEFDREAIDALEAAGHKFDGQPMAMALDLAAWDAPDPGGLDFDAECDLPELGQVNETAYGLEPESGFAAMFAERPEGLDLQVYRARVDGEVACVLATIDHEPTAGAAGPDCGIYFVATLEAARGRGLATRLLGAALAQARERGCATSTLQASGMGEPVYVAMGYEPLFRFHMYERRRPQR